MELRTEELNEIETVTLGHYDQNAEAFWQGTKDHDVAQNYKAFLAPFPKDKKLDILDFGCGPGRDVSYFKSLAFVRVVFVGALVLSLFLDFYCPDPPLCQYDLRHLSLGN